MVSSSLSAVGATSWQAREMFSLHLESFWQPSAGSPKFFYTHHKWFGARKHCGILLSFIRESSVYFLQGNPVLLTLLASSVQVCDRVALVENNDPRSGGPDGLQFIAMELLSDTGGIICRINNLVLLFADQRASDPKQHDVSKCVRPHRLHGETTPRLSLGGLISRLRLGGFSRDAKQRTQRQGHKQHMFHMKSPVKGLLERLSQLHF
jgi:hypothetical protein